MSRLGWLVLLISLGVNLGLGYRLIVDRPGPPGGPGFPAEEGMLDPDRGPGPERADGRRSGRNGERWRDPDGRPALADSNRMREFMKHRLDSLARRLGLDEEQRSSLEEIHRRNGPRIIAQRIAVENARSQLMSVLVGSEPPHAGVRDAVHKVGRQEALLDSLITDSLLREMEFLTPEQRASYLKFLPGSRDHRPGKGRGRSDRDVPPRPED